MIESKIINKLENIKHEERICSYCWGKAKDKNGVYYCEECEVEVGEWHELI